MRSGVFRGLTESHQGDVAKWLGHSGLRTQEDFPVWILLSSKWSSAGQLDVQRAILKLFRDRSPLVRGFTRYVTINALAFINPIAREKAAFTGLIPPWRLASFR